MARTVKPRIGQKKKKSGRWGRIAFGALVLAAVAALLFFLVMREPGRVSIAENAVGTLFSPVVGAVDAATTYLRDVTTGVRNYFKMGEDLEDARREITDLKLQIVGLQEEALENDRLKSLLDAKESAPGEDRIYAKVIARNPGVWFDTFTINVGTTSGIQQNMAVVTGDGLVGRIYEVGANYAKVLSLIDSRSAVACLIERTRDNGVMRGKIEVDSETPECNMYYLRAVSDVTPGDVVLTSGVDTLFPKGIKVGTVTAVSREQDSSERYIVVMPSVDFQHIEEVLVLRTVVESIPEELPAIPTPSPRPTPVPTPSAEPTINPDAAATLQPDDAIWNWPTAMPDETIPGESGQPEAAPTPASTVPADLLPEDAWAN
jgi:rod shape-determining protein MreC